VRFVLAGLGVLALGLMLATLLVLLAVVDRLGAAPRALADLGSRASAASAGAARIVGETAQSARDALDPTHPPRGQLLYDAELEELRVVAVGGSIASHPERELTLRSVEKRVGADSPEVAQYALVADRLRTPRETRVLGVVVSRSDDARQRVLYRAQLFRVGRALYKVNWVGFEGQQVGIGRLRSAEGAIGELAFAID
jgi:hypothetical protein